MDVNGRLHAPDALRPEENPPVLTYLLHGAESFLRS